MRGFLLHDTVLNYRTYVTSQYWIRHVVVVLKKWGCTHSNWSSTAAFDHDFGAVTDSDDPLMQSYTHLM